MFTVQVNLHKEGPKTYEGFEKIIIEEDTITFIGEMGKMDGLELTPELVLKNDEIISWSYRLTPNLNGGMELK